MHKHLFSYVWLEAIQKEVFSGFGRNLVTPQVNHRVSKLRHVVLNTGSLADVEQFVPQAHHPVHIAKFLAELV